MSAIVRGGATNAAGAASGACSAVSVATGAAGAGLLAAAFDISLATQLRTAGPAFVRQASRSPPLARMHACTIGLPTGI